MKMSNKKIIMLIGAIILICSIIWYFWFDNYREKNNLLKDGDYISYFVKNDEGEYELYKNPDESSEVIFKTIIDSGYAFDEEKSYCDSAEELEFNYDDNTIFFITTGEEIANCNLYFTDNYLYEEILINNSNSKNYNDAIDFIKEKEAPNFNELSVVDEGVFADVNLNDTNYYFRGAVDNNWVYFAGFYWRIIRIDENNNIRLIYSGSVQPSLDESIVMKGAKTQLDETTVYNGSFKEKSYVNYNDSELYYGLIKWYEDNLKVSYSQFISSNLYCNETGESTTTVSDKLYGTNVYTTLFNSAERIRKNDTSPTYKCLESHSLEDVVATLTADEVVYAGGKWGTENTSYYLYTNSNYWTISPHAYAKGNPNVLATMLYVGYDGSIQRSYGNIGARPVISLKSNILYTKGNGEYNNPYQIKKIGI